MYSFCYDKSYARIYRDSLRSPDIALGKLRVSPLDSHEFKIYIYILRIHYKYTHEVSIEEK